METTQGSVITQFDLLAVAHGNEAAHYQCMSDEVPILYDSEIPAAVAIKETDRYDAGRVTNGPGLQGESIKDAEETRIHAAKVRVLEGLSLSIGQHNPPSAVVSYFLISSTETSIGWGQPARHDR